MRLLNTSTLRLEFFERDIPLYVILSHTWADGEVTFDLIDQPHARYMPGYQKIERCCQKAKDDGFDYIWIDTCCIDKKSSSELSESINSMYRYYQNAEICYAFLSDVNSEEDPSSPDSSFRRSRWFKRGWTLQELIAPEVVEFYSSDWKLLGTKRTLVEVVEEITWVDRKILWKGGQIENQPIARKFSWLSMRTTTRKEDMAYCMLGIMNVNMPLIYGEGEKAFVRLQEELVKRTRDPTFLCWDHTDDILVVGSFCADPRAFCRGRNITWSNTASALAFAVTNHALEIKLPTAPPRDASQCHDSRRQTTIALPKNCYYHYNGCAYRVGIPFHKISQSLRIHPQQEQEYYRDRNSKLELWPVSDAEGRGEETMYIMGLVEPLPYPRVLKPAQISSIRIADVRTSEGYIQQASAVAGRVLYSLFQGSFEFVDVSRCLDPRYCFEVHRSECIGILVGTGLGSVLIAIGFLYARVYCKLRSGISEFNMARTLKELFKDRDKTTLIPFSFDKHLGDSAAVVDGAERIAEDGTKVTLSLRKKRDAALNSLFWEAVISIDTASVTGS